MIILLRNPRSMRPMLTLAPILSSMASLTHTPTYPCTVGIWSRTTAVRYAARTTPKPMFIMRLRILMPCDDLNIIAKLHHFFSIWKFNASFLIPIGIFLVNLQR